MPLYEYQCKPAGHRFETRHGVHETPVTACPECGGEVRRVIQPVGIVFKGSGFYKTDSRASKSAPASPAADGKGAAETGKPEAGKTETKTDGKTASTPATSKSETSESKKSGAPEAAAG